MNKQYFQYTFLLPEGEERDLLLAFLQLKDINSFEENTEELIAYSEKDISIELIESLTHYTFQKQILEQKNWNEEWEKNFQPVQVEDFVNIRANFHEALPGFQHEIIINPKMSFGTGHHATTWLMLQQMQGIYLNNKTVLDFGTGTGILSIMAEKLGAFVITSIDNDEWSISNAAENTSINNCNKIKINLADKPEGTEKYDVILANINKNVIIEHLHQLTVALKENGVLLLSGLLAEDEKEMIPALALRSFHTKKITERSGWVCIKATKNG